MTSPLNPKFDFVSSNVDFDSLKEASQGTECNPKNHKSLPSTVTEKIKKKHQNIPKTSIFGGNFTFFEVFLDFLSNGTWQRPMVFSVAFSTPRRFF